jgi:hypothetical protein
VCRIWEGPKGTPARPNPLSQHHALPRTPQAPPHLAEPAAPGGSPASKPLGQVRQVASATAPSAPRSATPAGPRSTSARYRSPAPGRSPRPGSTSARPLEPVWTENCVTVETGCWKEERHDCPGQAGGLPEALQAAEAGQPGVDPLARRTASVAAQSRASGSARPTSKLTPLWDELPVRRGTHKKGRVRTRALAASASVIPTRTCAPRRVLIIRRPRRARRNAGEVTTTPPPAAGPIDHVHRHGLSHNGRRGCSSWAFARSAEPRCGTSCAHTTSNRDPSAVRAVGTSS